MGCSSPEPADAAQILARDACPGVQPGPQLIDMASMARIAGAKLLPSQIDDGSDSAAAAEPTLLAIGASAHGGKLRLIHANWQADATVMLSFRSETNDAPSSAPACVVVSLLEAEAQRVEIEIDDRPTGGLELPGAKAGSGSGSDSARVADRTTKANSP